jgi:hypothetical protein
MNPGQTYSASEMERMMKLQDVLLKAMAKKITWWVAAEIIGVSGAARRLVGQWIGGIYREKPNVHSKENRIRNVGIDSDSGKRPLVVET